MSTFISTENIFTVIGDYPVVDQFDVSYSSLLSGSTNDNYITGSFLYANPNGQLEQGTRGLSFSKLGVNLNNFPPLKNDFYQSYCLQPLRERSGIIKNLRIFSGIERFYDSLLPSLSELVKESGSKIIWQSAPSPSTVLSLYLGDESFPSGDEWISMFHFNMSFPFEPKFSKVTKTNKFAKSFIATIETPDDTTYTVCDPVQSSNLIIFDRIRDGIPAGPYLYEPRQWHRDSSANYGPVEDDIIKIIFGLGSSGSKSAKNRLARRFYSSPVAIGPIISGWKYGLISGYPSYSSAVFRRDRYGQFRDMLEQRISSKSFEDPAYSPVNYFGSFEDSAMPQSTAKIEGSSQFLDGVVTVKFIKRTFTGGVIRDFPEKPENTQSSNLSMHATSSLPYFDGVVRNRNEQKVSPSNLVLSQNLDIFGNNTI